MKTIEPKIFNVKIKWNDICNSEGEPIQEENKELETILKEEGINRANEMIQQGYIEGELIYETDEVYARGWWSVAREVKL